MEQEHTPMSDTYSITEVLVVYLQMQGNGQRTTATYTAGSHCEKAMAVNV